MGQTGLMGAAAVVTVSGLVAAAAWHQYEQNVSQGERAPICVEYITFEGAFSIATGTSSEPPLLIMRE